MSADLTAADGSRTKHRRSFRRAFLNWAWPIIGDFPRELLRTKLARFIIAGGRFAWYALLLRRLRTTAGSGVAKSTLAHNIRGMVDLHVERSSRLIGPITSVAAANRVDVSGLRLLTIGPRTEGEILNLVSSGFRRRNITALDLISYSPWVQIGDMHAMPYGDASFDVVLAGWVISYSDDKQRAADEIARVAKPGAIIAIGVEWVRKTPEQIAAERTGYIVGSADRLPSANAILSLFGGRVDRIYAKIDDQDVAAADAGDLIVVFRLR